MVVIVLSMLGAAAPSLPAQAIDQTSLPNVSRVELVNDGVWRTAITFLTTPEISSPGCSREKQITAFFYIRYRLSGRNLSVAWIDYENRARYSETRHAIGIAAVSEPINFTSGSSDFVLEEDITYRERVRLVNFWGDVIGGSGTLPPDGVEAFFNVANTTGAPIGDEFVSYGCSSLMLFTLEDRVSDSRTSSPTYAPSELNMSEIQPFRAYDSRRSYQSKIGWRGTRCMTVAGVGGVPSDARAVAVNVTAVNPSGSGYITAYQSGSARPGTSNLNYVAGEVVANSATVGVGPDRKICLYGYAATDVIVDVMAYYRSSAHVRPIKAERVYDSGGTVSGTVCPRIADARATPHAVSINVTVVGATAPGHLRVYPRGESRPATSNLNYTTGQTRATEALVSVGSDNRVCIYVHSRARIIVDVQAYFMKVDGAFPQPAYFDSARPSRLWNGTVGAGSTTCVTAAGFDADGRPPHLVPRSADRVFVGLVMVSPQGSGYLTAHAQGSARPGTSNLNYRSGDVVGNSAVVAVGTNGRICVYSRAGGRLIIDLLGFQRI